MKITIALDENLVARAEEFSGIADRTELLHEALTALIQRESAHRLAKLGGSQPDIVAAPRRRPKLKS